MVPEQLANILCNRISNKFIFLCHLIPKPFFVFEVVIFLQRYLSTSKISWSWLLCNYLQTHLTKLEVNIGERSASFFQCFPLKVTKITLTFGVIINKNLSKNLPTTQQG